MSLPFGLVTRPSWVALEYLKSLGLEDCEPPTPIDRVEEDLHRRGIWLFRYHPSQVPEELKHAARADEYLVSTGDGVVLGINTSRPMTRQRFSIFHGAGHALMVWHKGVNYLSTGCVMHPLTTRPYEVEAHQFAAVMNMPPQKFREDMASLPFSLASIVHLAYRYRASIESAAIHFVSLSDRPCCLLICKQSSTQLEAEASPQQFLGRPLVLNEPIQKPTPIPAKKVVRVRYSKRSPNFPHFVRPGTPVASGNNPLVWASEHGVEVVDKIPGWTLGWASYAWFHAECRPLNPLYNPGDTIVFLRPVTSRLISVPTFSLDTKNSLPNPVAIGDLL